ncbi:MAG: TraB/GumN family protein [Desulfobacter sp.]
MGTGKRTAAAAVLAAWLVLACAITARADSPVWKISDGNRHLYLGGTIHVLGKADYPLPLAFDRAYANSRTLVFETDISQTEDPGFAKKMMRKMMYADQRTLKTRIRQSTYADLAKFSEARGIPVQTFDRFKPGLVMIFLTLAETERLGAGGTGVDEFYFKKGRADGRAMNFLEAPMDQVDLLANIGVGNEDEMIAYLISDIGQLGTLFPLMKKAWKLGNYDLLYKETLAPMKKDFPELYHAMMVRRNLAWLPEIQKLLATPEVEFILVGAGHLAGDQGLLELLRKTGADTENL